MTWQLKSQYHKVNGDWTLCVTGKEPSRKFGLSVKGDAKIKWFDTENAAKEYFNNLKGNT